MIVSACVHDGRRSGGLPPVAPSGAARSAGGWTAVADVFEFERSENEETLTVVRQSGFPKTAATYSPNWWVSTIGDGELNFSVRNGKRWILTAITTVVYYLREKVAEGMFPSVQQSEFRFSLAIFPLGKSLGQLVQVS